MILKQVSCRESVQPYVWKGSFENETRSELFRDHIRHELSSFSWHLMDFLFDDSLDNLVDAWKG